MISMFVFFLDKNPFLTISGKSLTSFHSNQREKEHTVYFNLCHKDKVNKIWGFRQLNYCNLSIYLWISYSQDAYVYSVSTRYWVSQLLLSINLLLLSHSGVSNSVWPYALLPPGSSVHGILQARLLEWVSIPSRGSSHHRYPNWVSYIAGRFFTTDPPEQCHMLKKTLAASTWSIYLSS